MSEIWKPLVHNEIISGYLLSSNGRIKTIDGKAYEARYHSTNGYDFELFVLQDVNGEENVISRRKLFPVDDLLAMIFVRPPKELINKRICVHHINGNNRDNTVINLEWIEEIENWKILEYPGIKSNMYVISNFGNVKNMKSGHLMSKNINRYGYPVLCLAGTEGVPKTVAIHRLVAFNYIDRVDNTMDIVNHIDSNKCNCYYKNLEWGTLSSNEFHAYLVGTKHVKRNYDESVIETACELLVEMDGDCNAVLKELRSRGIILKPHILSQIKSGKTWKGISQKYFDRSDFDFIDKERNFTEEELILIIKSLNENDGSITKTLNELIDRIPTLSISRLFDIKSGKCYKDFIDTNRFEFNVNHWTDESVVREICISLVKNNFSVSKTYNELCDKFPSINTHLVQNIKGKHAWRQISDEYF